MVASWTAYTRISNHYLKFLQKPSTDFAAIDDNYLHIEQAINWLASRKEALPSQNLLALMERLQPYCEARSLNNVILKNYDASLMASQRLGKNPATIHFSAYRAHWGLGHWDEAYRQIQLAVQESEQLSAVEHANALRFLGSLQLNRGNYRSALATLARAKEIFRSVQDDAGEASVTFEEAAYYLNITQYPTAFKLYSEILEFELARHGQASDNTLLMMGVITRRLKRYAESIRYHEQLFQRGEANKIKSASATAAHHLAWTYLEAGDTAKARELGELALKTYDEIKDPRGASDAYEQLGLIAMMAKQYNDSRLMYEKSVVMRNQLGNQHGLASSLRRLAKLNLIQARYGAAINYLFQSLATYKKIGMLSPGRIRKFISDIFSRLITT
jgi:tetratricopeptide (TPR) repeat protein